VEGGNPKVRYWGSRDTRKKKHCQKRNCLCTHQKRKDSQPGATNPKGGLRTANDSRRTIWAAGEKTVHKQGKNRSKPTPAGVNENPEKKKRWKRVKQKKKSPGGWKGTQMPGKTLPNSRGNGEVTGGGFVKQEDDQDSYHLQHGV